MYDAVRDLSVALEARGQSSSLTPALVKRALNLEFSTETFAKKVQKQAARRIGSGGKKLEAPKPHDGELESDPVLDEMFKRFEKANGE